MNKPPIRKRSRERIKGKCLQCANSFDVQNYRKDTVKYCSKKCTALATRIKHTTDCEMCKKTFEHISCRTNKAKYCSRKCYYQGQKNKGKTIYKCHHCEKQFKAALSTNRKYCSKQCVQKGNKITWKASFACVRKAMLARNMIKQCNRCGFNSHANILGVHHIDRNRHNNELSNLEVLCPNCHSIEHSKHINHTGYFE